jgi:hypothetical protein
MIEQFQNGHLMCYEKWTYHLLRTPYFNYSLCDIIPEIL